ncbi:hypothetical protein SAMN05421688_3445 [Poseidonocella pacifica]|uniref:Uncharacterized protein n=1 Tax=Poseidonocella pacifica TaxID=871651 RepID=A0A1I0YWX2_9RHOB|nr:hypothetical protein SAMN05421688_3445 [Poseidonocella pacifica]
MLISRPILVSFNLDLCNRQFHAERQAFYSAAGRASASSTMSIMIAFNAKSLGV